MTEPIDSGSAGGMIAFLDQLVAKGRATAGSVTPLKSASRRVLEVVDGPEWEQVDVRTVDVDDYMQRFGNKTRGAYTGDSLRAYASRLRRAIEWYQAFLTTPGWTPPPAGSRSPGREKKATNDGGRSSDAGGATSQPRASRQGDDLASPSLEQGPGLVTYPFPLQSGSLVYLRLPARLPRAEAKRLTAFLDSIAIDDAEDRA